MCIVLWMCVCFTRHNADRLPCHLACSPREYGVECMSGVDQFTYPLCKRSQGSLMTRVTALNGWTLDALIDLTASDGLLRRMRCVTCRKLSFTQNCSNLNILWEATLLRMAATAGRARRNGERVDNVAREFWKTRRDEWKRLCDKIRDMRKVQLGPYTVVLISP
jgi:hypothetical protein